MIKNNLKTAIKVARSTSKIMVSARNELLKSSFKSAMKLARVYRNASMKTLYIGRDVLKQTLIQAEENRSKFLKTSKQAYKDTVRVVKDVKKQEAAQGEKKELSIDDLL